MILKNKDLICSNHDGKVYSLQDGVL